MWFKMTPSTHNHEPFTFFIRFTLKNNRKWWDLGEFLEHQYSRDEFIAEVLKRRHSCYELTSWLMNNPSHWADFVNTFDIEYKEK